MDNKEQDTHPFREKMILQLERLRGNNAERIEDLSEVTRTFYSYLSYQDIITPMVIGDREQYDMTYGQLAIKYDVTERTIRWIFCCRRQFMLR